MRNCQVCIRKYRSCQVTKIHVMDFDQSHPQIVNSKRKLRVNLMRVRSSCVCFVYKYTHIALSDKPFRIIDRFNKADSAGVALRARFFTRNVKMATIQ